MLIYVISLTSVGLRRKADIQSCTNHDDLIKVLAHGSFAFPDQCSGPWLSCLQAIIRQRMLTLLDNVCNSAVPPTKDRRQESLLGGCSILVSVTYCQGHQGLPDAWTGTIAGHLSQILNVRNQGETPHVSFDISGSVVWTMAWPWHWPPSDREC